MHYTNNPEDDDDRYALFAYRGLGTRCGAFVLDLLTPQDSPWHETPEDVERGLAEGDARRRRLAWVRRTMKKSLTQAEREALQAYVFDGLTYRDAAAKLGRSSSTVHRAVGRAIRKLRKAARERPPG